MTTLEGKLRKISSANRTQEGIRGTTSAAILIEVRAASVGTAETLTNPRVVALEIGKTIGHTTNQASTRVATDADRVLIN